MSQNNLIPLRRIFTREHHMLRIDPNFSFRGPVLLISVWMLIACGTDVEEAAITSQESPRDTTDARTTETIPDADMSQAQDTGSSTAIECDDDSPMATNDTQCGHWQCELNAYPTCWVCQDTPVEPGTLCTTDEGLQGQCSELNCIADTQAQPPSPVEVGDLSTPGTENVMVSSVELSLGNWALNERQNVTIYAPADAIDAPVIIFHHGFNLSAQDYDSYGNHLASWGFVVVMPTTITGLFGGPTQRDMADILLAVIQWIDQSEVEANHPLAGKVSANDYVVAGHSLGGKLSFLVGTESTRVSGIFGIDPVDTPGGPGAMPSPSAPSVTPELMPQITVPFVVVGETTNSTSNFGPACAPSEENFARYFDAADGPALKIEILGANHMSFLDNPNCGLACFACPAGTDDPANTRRLTQKYLTAFSMWLLKGQADARRFLVGDDIAADINANLVNIETIGDF
jgi:predicted dienelactone hydrolase